MSTLGDWLRSHGPKDVDPDREPTEAELVFAMLDVLGDERRRRADPGWFPRGGERELEELARDRLTRSRAGGLPSKS